MIPSELNRSVH